jgi:hypothetical protein
MICYFVDTNLWQRQSREIRTNAGFSERHPRINPRENPWSVNALRFYGKGMTFVRSCCVPYHGIEHTPFWSKINSLLSKNAVNVAALC